MRMFLSPVVAAILLLTRTAGAQALVPMPDSGGTSFGNWSFTWEIGDANREGLVLRDVRWKKRQSGPQSQHARDPREVSR